MLKGSVIQARVCELLQSGQDLEVALHQVVTENLEHLPSHLKSDPKAVGEILSAAQFYATEAHPEFVSASEVFDTVLLRLIPKEKTARYVQQLNDEALEG